MAELLAHIDRNIQPSGKKIDELSKLSNIDDIIFYEIYLHRYGSDKAFADAVDKIKLPEKKKRKK